MTVGEARALLVASLDRRGPLPVASADRRYLGMAHGEALAAAPDLPMAAVATRCRPVAAAAPVSLLLERMAAGEQVVPIVADDGADTYLGAADRESMLRLAAALFPQLDDYTELTIACPSGQYSASAIAHAVEDADAHLLNLNVVAGTRPNSPTTALLRVNHSRGESVARSLARYGYDTLEVATTPGLPAPEMLARVNSLLHYLEM